jgi:hypothetical protein
MAARLVCGAGMDGESCDAALVFDWSARREMDRKPEADMCY